MNSFLLSLTKLNETLNYNDFTVVWISSDGTPNKLKKIYHDLIEYDSCETCEIEIKKIESERKFLIVLKGCIPKTDFENLCQIQLIYILKEKHQNLEYNSNNHSKVVGIFENIDTLIDRLDKDILLTDKSDLPISISPLHEVKNEQSLNKLDGNTLMFLWDQLFIYYLVHPIEANMEQLKIDMLEQCKVDYKNNEYQLHNIDSFNENCSDKNALEWYTKDSFLYRILNKAFRTRNIDFMRKFQYFIILLYKNFKLLSKSHDKDLSIVYRGQIMNKNDLDKLKSSIGHLISMNTILSTSCNEETARSFILEAENAVVFKINIPNQSDNSFIPFIDISKYSTIPLEREVLFFLGTVFSIDSIQNGIDSPCVIELTLNNDPCNHFTKLISIFAPDMQNIAETYLSLMKTDDFLNIIQGFINTTIDSIAQKIKEGHHSIMETDDFNMIEQYYYILTNKQFSTNANPTLMIYIHLAFFFSNLGLYDRAIQFYKQALSLKDISTKDPEFIVIHIIIGYLYYHLSQYDEADVYYAIVLSLSNKENLLTSELYRHIADTKEKRNNLYGSLSCYQNALKIANNRYIPSLQYIYRKIIDILETQGNSNDADIYKKKLEEIDPDKYYISLSTWSDPNALEDCRYRLNNEHDPIKRADLLYKIGLHCVVQGYFEEALEQLLQAKDLYISQPPSWNRFPGHLSALFDNIAMLYLFFKDYLKSLIMWRKAILIRIVTTNSMGSLPSC